MTSRFNHILKPLQVLNGCKGNVLVYLVLVLLIFGVLGVTLLSIFSLATQSSSEPNYHRRVSYIRESAIRYALSELKNSDFDPDVIEAINTFSENDDDGYEIARDGRFRIKVFSPWFDAAQPVNVTSGGDFDVRLPVGKLADDWVARDPNNLWILNYDYLDSDLPSVRDRIVSWAKKAGDTTGKILTITIGTGGDISASIGERICVAALPTETRTISDGGDLYIQEEAEFLFPAANGAINIDRRDYVYERLVPDPANNRVILEGVSASTMPNREALSSITVNNTYDSESGFFNGDFIVLSPRNHIMIPTAYWKKDESEDIEIEGTIDNALNIVNLATIQPLTRNPDIDFSEENLTQALTQIETSNFITENNTNKTLDIGSGVSGQSDFGAAWYDENKRIGGQNSICVTGACSFGLGIRVFFTLDYTGTADGLTFALINSASNTANSVGGDINMEELLAYGGDSRLVSSPDITSEFLDTTGDGLRPPKFAVEFDTFGNNDTLKFCNGASQEFDNRNDPFEDNRDAIHFVFWGFKSLVSDCRNYTLSGTDVTDHPTYDDNQHDSGESEEVWSPFTTGGPVRSTPTVADDGTIYVGSDDGYLYAINPDDGSQKWKFDTGGKVISSPVVGSDGMVYVGSYGDGTAGRVYGFNPADRLSQPNGSTLDTSNEWVFFTPDIIDSSPAIGSDGTVYIGDNQGNFFALDPASRLADPGGNKDSLVSGQEWLFTNAGLKRTSKGRPAIGADGKIYITGSDPTDPVDRTLFALDPADGAIEWSRDTGDVNYFMPAADPNTGFIYVEQDNQIRALTSAGAQGWITPIGTNRFTPVVANDGTVYAAGLVVFNKGIITALDPTTGAEIWNFTDSGNLADIRTTPAIGPGGTVYFGAGDGLLHALNPDGSPKWTFAVPVDDNDIDGHSSPTVSSQGVVYIGSSGDSKLYAVNDFAIPRNIKDNVITSVDDGSDVRVAGEIVTVDDVNDWLEGTTDKRWAIRLEVLRGQTQNANLNYKYTLRLWIRQCNSVACDNTIGTFFQDTRIEYAPLPDLTQTVELTDPENTAFNRFLFGFTGATGPTTSQNAVIADFLLSFIRPNDPIAGN